MIKKLFLSTVASILCITGYSQEQSNGPEKGDFTLGATVGYNSYVGFDAPSGLLNNYELKAMSTDWFKNKMMIGIEGNWFFSSKWALRLGGGLSFTGNPGYPAYLGTADEKDEEGDGSIPNYRAVASAQSLKYNAYLGVNRYFQMKKAPNLYLYTGLQAGVAYGSNQMKYDEETSMGRSTAEVYNIRGAINFGADYYVLPAMFVGIEVSPLAYTYNMTTIKPQEGLKPLSADSHNFAFLSAPTIKVGFKF